MAEPNKPEQITLLLSEKTLEQVMFLAERDGISMIEMASKLLSAEAEAQSSLARGPFLRKYMYR